ncbi:TlpA family protein disulfide reductase [Chryseobacterium aahli]|uniref:TlpA family protein disulfide reductase n=1 Tax=Chryseobacterium aahli TaxID=1278643 RepID=UPI001F60A298|nr:TlpA disulfide reductase family protein [Chryseobacterium aahli]MCI3937697.1 TlpA family protein disulfide reductase [Chryseobacterium aahli]
MIVHTMDMVIKLLNINSSRFLYLLFLCSIFNCSNTSEKQIIKNNAIHKDTLSTKIVKNDSLQITVKNIAPETTVSFIYNDVDFNSKYVNFENKSDTNSTITKKVLKTTNFDYTFLYRTFTMIDNKLQTYYHDYFINKSVQQIEFLFDNKNGNVELQNHDGIVIKYDNITNGYQQITKKTNKFTPSQKIQKIENLHIAYQKKFTDTEQLSINDLVFYKQLSLLSPKDKRIEDYLIKIKEPIWSTDLLGIVYQYIQAEKENIYSLNLNKNKNELFNNLIEIGISNHLQQYKDKKYANYDKNVDWFKNTDYYKSNKIELEKLLVTDEKSNSIKNELLSFDLYSDNKVVKLENILSNHNSKYYLLDFWATWCIPCLQNIEAMHNMDLPKDLELIYISMDRTKDKEKWIKKAQNLHLSNSYLFAETLNNKNIIKRVNLNQLPRYILIDKNYNIINPNLATPQEADFLKELKIYMKD